MASQASKKSSLHVEKTASLRLCDPKSLSSNGPLFKRPGGDNKWKPVSSHSIVQETKCVDVKTGRIAQAVLAKQWQSVTVATGFVKPTPRLKPRPAPTGVIRFPLTTSLIKQPHLRTGSHFLAASAFSRSSFSHALFVVVCFLVVAYRLLSSALSAWIRGYF